MGTLRIELVIGFALLIFVGVPVLVRRAIDAFAPRVPDAPPPSMSVKAAPAVGRTCPYCKDDLVDGSVHIECATCATWHHATCFEENQGCAVFGCKERRGKGHASEHV